MGSVWLTFELITADDDLSGLSQYDVIRFNGVIVKISSVLDGNKISGQNSQILCKFDV